MSCSAAAPLACTWPAGAEIYPGSPATKPERTSDGLALALGLDVAPGMTLPTATQCQVTGAAGQVRAAADVTGATHTHASYYQAGVVAANILGRRRDADYSAIPRCVFTTPAVFAVGAVPEAPRDDEDTGTRPLRVARLPEGSAG